MPRFFARRTFATYGTSLTRLSFLAAAFFISQSSTSLAQILNPANGHYYEFVDQRLPWEVARLAAESQAYGGVNGHLATVTSQAEQDFLIANFPFPDVWLGGYQIPGSIEPGEGWTWVTDEPFVYDNWYPTEPNNIFGDDPNENRIIYQSDGGWNDAAQAFEARYFIEYGATDVADAIHYVGYQAGPIGGLPIGFFPDGASYFDGGQWLGYNVPGSADTAIFDHRFDPQDNGMRFDVYFGNFTIPVIPQANPTEFMVPGGDARIERLRIASGDFTFHFTDDQGNPQGSLSAMQSVQISDDHVPASLTLMHGSFASNYIRIGVGANSDGTLTIEDGATVSNGSTDVAISVGAVGAVVVRGPGTTWTSAEVNIGYRGHGTMSIRDGGIVEVANTLRIGNQSLVDVGHSGIANVGSGPPPGPGKIRVGAGGVIAGNGTVVGDILVDGGTVSPGFSPGVFRILGDLELMSGSSLVIEIGGAEPGLFDQINVAGTFMPGGELVVRFQNGYVPPAVTSFPLITAYNLGGTRFDSVRFENIDPNLIPSSWLDGSFAIMVVPEPTAAVVMLVCSLAMFTRIRPRRTGNRNL